MKRIVVFWFVLLLSSVGKVSYAEFDIEHLLGNIEVHGFISQGFLESYNNNFYADTEDGTFQFNEFGINFSTELTDRLHAGLQLFSRDIGDLGNNDIEIDWAYGDYHWKDWLGFRAGKIKLSYGLYNETRDIDAVRTSILLPWSLYDETFRDTYTGLYGLEAYGYLNLGFLGSISYQIQHGEKDITTNSGIAKGFQEPDEVSPWFEFVDITNIEIEDVSVVSLEWNPPLDGLRLKGWIGTYDFALVVRTKYSPEVISQGATAEPFLVEESEIETFTILAIEYTWKDLTLAAEYVKDRDVDEAYYVSAAYRLTRRWELGMYYSVFREDDASEQEEPDYLYRRNELVITTRFDLNDYWTFKVEGHIVDGAEGFFSQDNPDGLEEDSYLLAIKATFYF